MSKIKKATARPKFRFGRREAPIRPHLKMRDYVRKLPTPPTTADKTASTLPAIRKVYLNDRIGDCVIAGGARVQGVWNGLASGTCELYTDDQIVQLYSAIGGYVPGRPWTDNGCVIQEMLDYWVKTGMTGGDPVHSNKAEGYLAVDATNQEEVMVASWLFCLIFGMGLPNKWLSPTPSRDGFTWDVAGAANPYNGHCVVDAGYTARGVTICTWGMYGTLTWGAVKKYAVESAGGELWAAISKEQLNQATQRAPSGLDWAQLVTDFDAMGGNVPQPPAPPPTPTPDPTPGPDPEPTPDSLVTALETRISTLYEVDNKSAAKISNTINYMYNYGMLERDEAAELKQYLKSIKEL